MTTLHIERATFAWPGLDPTLDDVTLHLGEGWTGVVGANGAGKTTLLRLIAGELAWDGGRVRLDGLASPLILCCPQRVEALDPAMQLLAAAADAEAGALRARLRLQPEGLERWATCSPGERKRWQLGVALWRRPDVLLLDEPTNHLDAEGRELLWGALAGFCGVGLLVSHDRTLLDGLTQQTLLLGGGDARLLPGAWSQAALLLEAEARARAAQAKALRAEVERARGQLHEARVRQQSAERSRSRSARVRNPGDREQRSILAQGRADRAAAQASRSSSSRSAALRRAEDALAAFGPAPPEPPGDLFLGWEPPRQRRLAWLDLAALRAGERQLAGPLTLELLRDARVHLSGPNGAGKSTLLRAVRDACTLPEERVLWLPQELTRADEEALRQRIRALPGAARGRLLALAACLGIAPAQALSGDACSPGEARKLLLAEGLARPIGLALLDEPTNHLDLPSIARLQSALAAFPGALVLTSHDDALAAALASTRWRLRGGALVEEPVGAETPHPS